jgi:hypothetical protein
MDSEVFSNLEHIVSDDIISHRFVQNTSWSKRISDSIIFPIGFVIVID